MLIKVVLGAVHTLIHAFVAQDLEHSFFSVLPLREAVPQNLPTTGESKDAQEFLSNHHTVWCLHSAFISAPSSRDTQPALAPKLTNRDGAG